MLNVCVSDIILHIPANQPPTNIILRRLKGLPSHPSAVFEEFQTFQVFFGSLECDLITDIVWDPELTTRRSDGFMRLLEFRKGRLGKKPRNQ